MDSKNWIAIGAASVLGLGVAAGGAASIANAIPLIENATGLSVPGIGTVTDGDLWYNSSTGKFRGRQAGTSLDLIGGGGSGASSAYGVLQANYTLTSATTAQPSLETGLMRVASGSESGNCRANQ